MFYPIFLPRTASKPRPQVGELPNGGKVFFGGLVPSECGPQVFEGLVHQKTWGDWAQLGFWIFLWDDGGCQVSHTRCAGMSTSRRQLLQISGSYIWGQAWNDWDGHGHQLISINGDIMGELFNGIQGINDEGLSFDHLFAPFLPGQVLLPPHMLQDTSGGATCMGGGFALAQRDCPHLLFNRLV